MTMKRVLGLMLASRMAGRGRGRGGLGRTAALGGLGGLGGGMGRRAGVAGMAYMAYRAYQDKQSRQPQTGAATSGSTQGSGGIGGMISDLADRFSGTNRDDNAQMKGAGMAQGGHAPAAGDDGVNEEHAAAAISEDTALLLLRGMISAANADGIISADERARIMQELDESGADTADRRQIEDELANPKPLDTLLVQIHDKETAEEFYLASRAAVDVDNQTHKAYLDNLRQRLNLSEEEAREIDSLA